MGAIAGSAIYGAVRGLSDAERQAMEAEGFQTDQAIRRQRLLDEQQLQPLRMRAAQSQVDTSDLEAQLARLSLKDREDLQPRIARARQDEEKIQTGLRKMYASGDPNHLLQSLAEIDPQYKEARAEVDYNDGSITFNGPKNQPLTFRATKDPNTGETITPEDQIAHMALKVLNPVEHLRAEIGTKQKTTIEAAKQSAISDREILKQTGAEQRARIRAEGIAGRETTRRVQSELRHIPAEINRQVKTVSVPGAFTASYANEDDAQLTGIFAQRAADIYNKGVKDEDESVTVPAASRQAISETRTEFLTQKKSAMDAASALAKKKIKASDPKALGAAARAGDADAVAVVKALKEIEKRFGADTVNYVVGQLPAK